MRETSRLTALIRVAWLIGLGWGIVTPAAGAAEVRPVVAIVISGVASADIDGHSVSFAASRRDIRLAEESLAECIAGAIDARNPGFAPLKPAQFYEIAFPDLTPDEAPRSLESLIILLQDGRFRKRLAEAGVTHLVIAGGSAERRHAGGSVGLLPLFVTPAGILYAFWGTAVWSHDSRLTAYILDLKRGLEPSPVSAGAADSSSIGVYLYLPVGKRSRAEAEACGALGTSVAEALAGLAAPPETR